VGLLCVAAALSACSDQVTAPEVEVAALLDVRPAPGSVDVSVGTTVTITFDHAIAEGMDAYAALHEGTLTGPIVDGTWDLSADLTVLTFTPAEQLKAATTYVVHLGGGMMDAQGNHVGLEEHGLGMGGQWASETMMNGGMGSGMGHGGMGQNSQMMGEGWAHPTNGSYGMIFSFTTAG
jgi:hypothetical protein